MLRLLLVNEPGAEQQAAVVEALARTPLTSVYAAPALLDAARALAAPHALDPTPDARLEDGAEAIALVEAVAERTEGSVALVAMEAVIRHVLTHALAAPIAQERLVLDPGALAEVEVRLDAPWTVNRLNDACHLDAPYGGRVARSSEGDS